jgi:hypothetical protein
MEKLTQLELYVSNSGDDTKTGAREDPFATIQRAQAAVRAHLQSNPGPVQVFFEAGTYYLGQTLAFTHLDSGTADGCVTYSAREGDLVTISGGIQLQCNWQPYKDGIMMCHLPQVESGDLTFDQLFVNGKRQTRARYPNHDQSDPKKFSGYIRADGSLTDAQINPHPHSNEDMTFSSGAPRGVLFDPTTFTKKRWKKAHEAIIHIYQAMYWGNLQWQIQEIDWDKNILWFGHGGQQMGAKWFENPCVVNEGSFFFIENIFEELDAPDEWYLDHDKGILYYLPPDGLDLESAVVEVPVLQHLIEFIGTQNKPVEHITLCGIRFAHTTSTFLETYEVPSLSDWAIHRGGAIYLQGAHHCTIQDCFFDAVGGNAVFMNEHNRNNLVTGCKFTESGDSAICFVGSLERTVGTQRNFPFECSAINNLIHDCGVFGKQIAGVYISRAKRIRVAHQEIFNMPRAGICIGDGTWGGHIIENNYIYETCRETGDHGPFNSWGRDKYWCLGQSHLPYTNHRSHDAGLVKIDAMEPVIMRYNFFKETAGWGLDLDDGASNYEIYNNLCVGVSIKLREGAYRTIYNNIWVNGANSPCFHVGNENNRDRYFRNITMMSVMDMKPEYDLNFEMGAAYGEIYTLIAPPVHTPWLDEIDYNCFYSDLGEFVARVTTRSDGRFAEKWDSVGHQMEARKYKLEEWQELGFDQHSVFADPLFFDPEKGDYRVQPESPALKLGFENFNMDNFGLTSDFPPQWRD